MKQTVTAAPPFSKIDWTVAIVLIPFFQSGVNPGDVELALLSPTNYKTYVTMSGLYNLNNCGTYLGVPVYDNTSAIWGTASTSSLCSATAYTPYSNGYLDPSGNFDCFTGTKCSFGTTQGTFVSDPFAQTFQKGAGTASGTWTFELYDDDGGNTLTSWILQFYREFLSWTPNTNIFSCEIIRGLH